MLNKIIVFPQNQLSCLICDGKKKNKNINTNHSNKLIILLRIKHCVNKSSNISPVYSKAEQRKSATYSNSKHH